MVKAEGRILGFFFEGAMKGFAWSLHCHSMCLNAIACILATCFHVNSWSDCLIFMDLFCWFFCLMISCWGNSLNSALIGNLSRMSWYIILGWIIWFHPSTIQIVIQLRSNESVLDGSVPDLPKRSKKFSKNGIRVCGNLQKTANHFSAFVRETSWPAY